MAERRADAADTDKRVAQARLKQAEVAMEVERARADALSTTIDELRAGQALMLERHARELSCAQRDARMAQQAASEARRAKPRGRRGAACAAPGTAGGGGEAPANQPVVALCLPPDRI